MIEFTLKIGGAMEAFVVLGQVPGTNLVISFDTWLVGVAALLLLLLGIVVVRSRLTLMTALTISVSVSVLRAKLAPRLAL